MPTGTIRDLVLDRGFGFVIRDDDHEKLFFHLSELDHRMPWDSTLREMPVTFDVETRADGRLRAKTIRPAR